MSRWLAGLVLVLGLQSTSTFGEPKRQPPVPQPVALNPEKTVLLDRAGKRLLLKARVSAPDQLLDMLF